MNMAIGIGKQLSLLAVFLSVIPGPAWAGSRDGWRPSSIRIGIIGDQTYAPDLDAAYGVLQQGVAALSSQGVRVVLHVGDLLESTQSPEAIRQRFGQATAILDQLPVPWYLTAGDHDVNPPAYQPDSSDRSREALFQELYGARVPAVRTHPYYSFDVAGVHFVSLYAFETLDADPRWGDVFLSAIGDDQVAWLADDLEAHRSARQIVVFVHQPLWYNWSGWQRVHALLARYPVAAVVAGHFHYAQDEGTLDGIRYLVVGSTGGATKDGTRNAGDVYEVAVLTVSAGSGGGRSASLDLVPLDGQPLALTPRVDMDRVQTLDLMLGNLYDFGTINPVYVKDGALVDACTGGNPATLELVPIGNSIDVPLDVSVAFDPGAAPVALSSPGFTTGQCRTVVSPTECLLARGARVWISNNSSVQVDPYAPPLWQAGLVLQGAPPPAGTPLNLDVRLSFAGKSGTLALHATASTTVAACP
jgi:hypothetical protein